MQRKSSPFLGSGRSVIRIMHLAYQAESANTDIFGLARANCLRNSAHPFVLVGSGNEQVD